MTQPSPVTNMPARTEQGSVSLVHRQWLLLAQVAWIVVTLLILGLDIVALPRYDGVLQTVCAVSEKCFSDQLTALDVRVLQADGISVGVYATVTIALNSLVSLVGIALGALLFWRRSFEPVALLCAFMLVTFFGLNTATHEGLAPLSLGWYTVVEFLDFLGQMSLVLFFFLFPTGRFVPRWTRWVALLYAVYYVWTIIRLQPGTFTSSLEALLFFGLLLTLVVAQIYRFRRVSTPRQREQTKWVMFAVAIAIIGFIIGVGSATFIIPASSSSSIVLSLIGPIILSVLFGLIPCSIVISILYSQLWDIDVLINKALVYGLLSALLLAVYVGLVLSLQVVLGGLLHQTNGAAFVVSTLVIAGLFQPLRRRIQELIDRRFYRRKYDAEKTLAAFSATLRNTVDRDQLCEQLMAVVQDTMHPTALSLWLRPQAQLPAEPAYHLGSDGQMSPHSSKD